MFLLVNVVSTSYLWILNWKKCLVCTCPIFDRQIWVHVERQGGSQSPFENFEDGLSNGPICSAVERTPRQIHIVLIQSSCQQYNEKNQPRLPNANQSLLNAQYQVSSQRVEGYSCSHSTFSHGASCCFLSRHSLLPIPGLGDTEANGSTFIPGSQ